MKKNTTDIAENKYNFSTDQNILDERAEAARQKIIIEDREHVLACKEIIFNKMADKKLKKSAANLEESSIYQENLEKTIELITPVQRSLKFSIQEVKKEGIPSFKTAKEAKNFLLENAAKLTPIERASIAGQASKLFSSVVKEEIKKEGIPSFKTSEEALTFLLENAAKLTPVERASIAKQSSKLSSLKS